MYIAERASPCPFPARILMRAYGHLKNYPEEAVKRNKKNLFCKKRSHDKLITFSHLPESTAGIGTLLPVVVRPCAGCRGIIGPVPPPLWIRVLLYSIVVNLYHSHWAVSIGNLHEIRSLIELATCPTHFDQEIWFCLSQQHEAISFKIASCLQTHISYAGSGAGFGLLLDGVGASGAGLLGLGGAGGVPLPLSSFGNSSPFHTFSKSS